MVHTSAIVFAALTIGVASTLAHPARSRKYSKPSISINVPVTVPTVGSDVAPAGRRDLEEEMFARDFSGDESELVARGRRGRGRKHRKHRHRKNKQASPPASPPASPAPVPEAAAAPTPEAAAPAARRDLEEELEEMFARDFSDDESELVARGRRGRGRKHRHHKNKQYSPPASPAPASPALAPEAAAAPTPEAAAPAARRDLEEELEEMFARDFSDDEFELVARGRRGKRGGRGRGRKHRKHRHHKHKQAASPAPAEAAAAPAPAEAAAPPAPEAAPAARRDFSDDEFELIARGRRGGRGRKHHRKHRHHKHKQAAPPAAAPASEAAAAPPAEAAPAAARRDFEDEFLFEREIDELD